MAENIKLRMAKRLRALRDQHGYTQQYLAGLARVDYKHIQRLESKVPPAARIDTLERIAHAFKMSLSELLDF